MKQKGQERSLTNFEGQEKNEVKGQDKSEVKI